MKKLLLSVGLISTLFANAQNDYQKYLQLQSQQFTSYKQSLNDGFKEYKENLRQGFADYKKELSKYWKNPELSTKTTFIEYSKDKQIKKKVDYKNNYIEIDVLSKNLKDAEMKLAKSLYSLSTETTKQAFNNNPVLKKVNKTLVTKYPTMVKQATPKQEPLIADMLFKKPPTQQKAISYSVDSVKKHKITIQKSQMPNINIYKLRIPLPSNGFLAKARIYKQDVFKRAYQFKLLPEFIYAIIQTESSFNPMARSYIPAFGLMQIVPSSAGADAYKMLTGKKRILAPNYLYNSQNNILIGSAYLKRIYYGYMRKVKNPLSRLYCTIAAYNTGAGNVACAFNSTSKDWHGKTKCSRSAGDYNILKASYDINKLTPNQVYNHLLSNLRFDEPKNYLRRVTKRLKTFKKVIQSNAL